MDQLMLASIRGARSVRVLGWMGQECESAALESLARRPCRSEVDAYLRGRSAALDEFRRLSGFRRGVLGRTVPLDAEPEVAESGFAEVEALDVLARLRLTLREHQAVRLLASGLTGREAAAVMGVDPSRVTELRRAAAAKIDRRRIA